MALTKRTYKDHKVVITAKNLNDIQDSIIALEKVVGIVPGEGEATRTISVVNPNGNLTLAEAVALPDGLYWFKNPVAFTNEDQTETFQISGLVAKQETAWLSYDTGTACATDDSGILQVWLYTCLPSVTEEDNGKVLSVVGGRWVTTDPESIFPDAEEATF